MTDLTPEALDALAALDQAATPGPWEAGRFFWKIGSTRGLADEFWVSVEAAGSVVASAPEEAPPSGPNAALIAAMRNALAPLVAAARERDALRDENDRLLASLTNRERDRAELLAEKAVLGDTGICRTCTQPVWFEEGEIGHRQRVGWSDRIKQGGDSLICFRAIHYRHAPMVDRERAIWDAATKAALTTGSDRG